MNTRNTFFIFALAATITVSFMASAQSEKLSASKAAKDLLLVCNKGDHTLSLINPGTGEQLASVPEDGVTGHEVVASADGRLAFVPIYGNSGVGRAGTDGQIIRVIDLEKRAVIATVDFGRAVRPHCAVMGPKNGLLYITTELSNSIAVVDPKTFKILGAIPTGESESHMLAITSDGHYGYTANVGPGTVSVLDLKEQKTLKIIPVSKVTQRISISPDDHWVFTADQTKPNSPSSTQRKTKSRIRSNFPGSLTARRRRLMADGLSWPCQGSKKSLSWT
jgi:DNA-binding beta-propeller fold protein YncE